MDTATFRRYLDDPAAATDWLRGLGVIDTKRAHGNLVAMASSGLTLDLMVVVADQLGEHLHDCADPDMALNNLERFVAAWRNPLAAGTLFERDPATMPILLQIFATSQHFSDLLATDPEALDVLRRTEGAPVARQTLIDELTAEVEALDRDEAVLGALRQFKRRETMRIAYGDIIREQSLQTVTQQISYLADAIVEAALRAGWRKLSLQRGTPRDRDGQTARFVVLAMGKLGGCELNYSSDIDLILLRDGDGTTDGRRAIGNREFFEQLAREIVRLLTETTELGSVYRVDLRLRPEGSRGEMAPSVSNALSYYDLRGRTWERQAYIKARAIAGDVALGEQFLDDLAPWIYRRYLSRADISGIKALKRRIEQKTHGRGADARNVKTGHGGIRDVEFVIQFLQLLNGGDLPALRTGNTLEAMAQLEAVGCLTNQERTLLETNYSFLRKIEHRLQIMFDLQTHELPERRDELRKLARRMGYRGSFDRSALGSFERHYRRHTELNRRILDHLLHDAFSDDEATRAEVDLVLDPDPGEDRIAEVLGKYPFRDVKQAYRNLMALSEEKIRFLSTRRCRHFLASIAPQLLEAIAATPDPDSTLINLGKVSDSLGGKGVLWELFSFNQPSLRLYVELCAYSPYLCDILTSNPGMIDGLMDSLVLDKLPTLESLERNIAELCYAAEDVEPILHSFKNDQQLRVGVRDVLGKEDIQGTTGTLSDVARACLAQIASMELKRLVRRFGEPLVAEGRRAGKPCEAAILAMGKFGGREMNYHSDLDVVFLYEADGQTAGGGSQGTSNQHFFSEWAQRVINTASRLGAYGRLYEVDARLRPTGRSGALATSLAEFNRYFAEGVGQLWERQALCKARVVWGSARSAKAATAAVNRAAFGRRWRRRDVNDIRRMRNRLEETASAGDLKRGPGGIVDVEFLVQMLQLKHGRGNDDLRRSNTIEAIGALHRAKIFSADDAAFFQDNYRFLRTIESRLRLLNSTARDRLPDDPAELTELAKLLHYHSGQALLDDFEHSTHRVRERFERIFDAAGAT